MRLILICFADHRVTMSQPAHASGTAEVSLASLHKGDRGAVARVLEGDQAVVGDVVGSTISRRLLEIGFVPGEPVEVVEETWPGGDPMAVRIGVSIFALRPRRLDMHQN
jgi:ferrous iron transport protein A